MSSNDNTGKKGKMKILIAGDIMLDIYSFGKASRISPEAPVPVLLKKTDEMKYVMGGAANVAANLLAAGADVSILSVIGKDTDGNILLEQMKNSGIHTDYIIRERERVTTTKLRYIGQNNQQLLRVDTEDTFEISWEVVEDKLKMLEKDIAEYSLIILSDYKKGFLTLKITQSLITMTNTYNIPVLVDVKDRRYDKYKGAFLIKPNREELGMLTGMPVEKIEDVAEASIHLCRMTESQYVLTTLGADGMLLVDNHGVVRREQSKAQEVYDVTGAGDTFIAYLGIELAGEKNILEAVRTANYAAGIQVSKVGTGMVYPDEIYKAMGYNTKLHLDKQLDYYLSDDREWLNKEREQGKRIVFTNGCFDILHAGHAGYLKKAASLGDILIVGVNSDASVRRLKGEKRPVNKLEDRLVVLAALECVDYVIPFEEDTPIDLIKAVEPDVLVKGGDYQIDDIVGADFVKAGGGTVTTIPFVEGKSTTDLINRMQQNL